MHSVALADSTLQEISLPASGGQVTVGTRLSCPPHLLQSKQSGKAAAALLVEDAQVVFFVQPAASRGALDSLRAEIVVASYGFDGDNPIRSIDRDVTGAFLAGNGVVAISVSKLFASLVSLRLTNQSASAQLCTVRGQIFERQGGAR